MLTKIIAISVLFFGALSCKSVSVNPQVDGQATGIKSAQKTNVSPPSDIAEFFCTDEKSVGHRKVILPFPCGDTGKSYLVSPEFFDLPKQGLGLGDFEIKIESSGEVREPHPLTPHLEELKIATKKSLDPVKSTESEGKTEEGSFLPSLATFKKAFESFKKTKGLDPLEPNKKYKTSELESEIGSSKDEIRNKMQPFTDADTTLGYATVSFESAVQDFEKQLSEEGARGTPQADLLKAKRNQLNDAIAALKSMRLDIRNTLKEYGQRATAIVLARNTRLAKLPLLRDKLPQLYPSDPDMQHAIRSQIDAILGGLASMEKLDMSSPLGVALDKNKEVLRLAVVGRGVSTAGLIGQAKGLASKPFALKAKSDSEGLVPVEQMFSEKVSADDRLLFDQLSFQARAVLRKGKGTPATAAVPYIREGLYNGIKTRFKGVALKISKLGSIAKVPIRWIPEDQFGVAPYTKDLWEEYQVHGDVDSMQGHSSSRLSQWRDEFKNENGHYPEEDPLYVEPEILETDQAPDRDKFGWARWHRTKYEPFKRRVDELADLQAKQVEYAEKVTMSYAKFLVKEEGMSPSDPNFADTVLKRRNSLKYEVPDQDLYTVVVSKNASDLLMEDSSHADEVGVMNTVANAMVRTSAPAAATLGMEANVKHSIEALNDHRPSNLANDYPLPVIEDNGPPGEATFTLIPKGPEENIHRYFMEFLVRKNKEEGMKAPVNVQYLLGHTGEFKNADVPDYLLEQVGTYAKKHHEVCRNALQFFEDHHATADFACE